MMITISEISSEVFVFFCLFSNTALIHSGCLDVNLNITKLFQSCMDKKFQHNCCASEFTLTVRRLRDDSYISEIPFSYAMLIFCHLFFPLLKEKPSHIFYFIPSTTTNDLFYAHIQLKTQMLIKN